jgi:hypothetical protein
LSPHANIFIHLLRGGEMLARVSGLSAVPTTALRTQHPTESISGLIERVTLMKFSCVQPLRFILISCERNIHV